MTVEQMRRVLGAKPFRPFRLRLADGSSVRVPSPEFAWLHPGGRTLYVATHDEAAEIIDLLLVAAIELGAMRGRSSRTR